MDINKKGVYMIIFPKKEFYIGSGYGKYGVKKRWEAHKKGKTISPKYLQKLAIKYGGWDNKDIFFILLENCKTKKQTLKREQFYMDKYWGNPLLLNKNKNVMRCPSMKGNEHPMYGKHHTKETRQKISKNHADFSGENNGRTKLNWEKVKEIRTKYKPFKYSLPKLAKEFNVVLSTIYRIILNTTWIDPDYTPPTINGHK